MTAREKRAKDVNDYFKQHGIEKTCAHYNLKWTTVSRYVRCANQYNEDKVPKVLIFDIETAPMLGYFWGLWKQTIHYEQIEADWFCLCWSAKWLFDDKILSASLSPDEVFEENDERIIRSIWQLLDEADVIIAHNGDKFDIKKLNTRFLKYDMSPPSPYRPIDTLKEARKNFGFTSNRIDFINKFLGLSRKIKTDFHLWKRCMRGEKEALSEMLEYNQQDVGILEELYVKMRGWIKSHPNMGLYFEDNEERCPNCGSTNIQWGGYYYTAVGKYSTLRCGNCGAIGRSRVTALSKEKKDSLTRPLTR